MLYYLLLLPTSVPIDPRVIISTMNTGNQIAYDLKSVSFPFYWSLRMLRHFRVDLFFFSSFLVMLVTIAVIWHHRFDIFDVPAIKSGLVDSTDK